VSLSADIVRSRLGRVREHARDASVDVLVVTHLPNVQYLTGFRGSAGAVILSPQTCILVVDFRYVTAAAGLAQGLDGLVGVVTAEHSYDQALAELLRQNVSRRVGVEGAYLPVSRFNSLAVGVSDLIVTERLVERARVIKDAAEVRILREAARRLADVARRVPAFVAEGRTEQAIAADVDAALRQAGFSRPAFDTIVASGPNSALPHARPTDRVLRSGDPTVLDFGGVYDGYCVDLTRTVQLGPVSEAIKQLYAAVCEAQQAAIRAVRPGVPASAIDAAARGVLERHGLGEVFGHGTGHGLGLEVHEEPRIARPTARVPDQTIESGMVFTIEPGAYVPGVGGVRIEDDVLVTDNGCEILTR